ncbi:MAG: DUF2027 domain-containing protein [Muribaculaceae bacterium]|nr:DUF2027 domain-containing protein [Muribaculaceae bacterium]
MAKIGDIVRYLNDVGGGRIVRIKDNMAWVDDDGFETPVLLKECVVVRKAEDVAKEKEAEKPTVAVKPAPPKVTPTKATDPEPEVPEDIETDGGDKLNIVLGFEPSDIKRLSTTDFDASLINDSNYFIYFSLSSRRDENEGWTVRYAGHVEPNTELWLGTYLRDDVTRFDRLMFQYIAFKRSKEFEAKEPGSAEIKVDTTKFFKLHCFKPNTYFENEVLAFELVKKDVPAGHEPAVEPAQLAEKMVTSNKPRRPERKSVKRLPINAGQIVRDGIIEVDLHINELLDNSNGMSPAEILNYQIDRFREIMDFNLKNFGQKIVFIHGKGEGVLRQAVLKELNNRYKGHDVQDASFQEYGFGATQVTIRQHPDRFGNKKR